MTPEKPRTTDPKYLQLDYQLCFAVYATSNAFVRAYNQMLQAFNLSYPEYLLMLVAWERDGQSLQEIATKLHLPIEAVRPVISRLEAQGFLARRMGVKTNEVSVVVTPEGLALREDVLRIRGEIGCMLGMDDKKLLSVRNEVLGVLGALEKEIARLKPAKFSYI